MRLINGDELERKLMLLPDDELCEDCCYAAVNAIADMPEVELSPFAEWFAKWSLTPETADWVLRNYSEFLCHMTGGKLSKIGYDLQTMKMTADDYQQMISDLDCAEGYSSRWIRVEDRLPDAGQLCLIYDGVHTIVGRHIANGVWVKPSMTREPTHWMLMPAMPKGGNK